MKKKQNDLVHIHEVLDFSTSLISTSIDILSTNLQFVPINHLEIVGLLNPLSYKKRAGTKISLLLNSSKITMILFIRVCPLDPPDGEH